MAHSNMSTTVGVGVREPTWRHKTSLFISIIECSAIFFKSLHLLHGPPISLVFSCSSSRLRLEENQLSSHLTPGLSPGLKLLAALDGERLLTYFHRHISLVRALTLEMIHLDPDPNFFCQGRVMLKPALLT